MRREVRVGKDVFEGLEEWCVVGFSEKIQYHPVEEDVAPRCPYCGLRSLEDEGGLYWCPNCGRLWLPEEVEE